MTKTQQDRVDETRRAICDAAVDLLSDTDYDRITVSQIAERAHVSRTTFYRYFNSVYEVVECIGDRILSVMEDVNRVSLKVGLSSDSVKVSPTLIMRLETLHSHRREALALIGPHGSEDFRIRVGKIMGSYFHEKTQRSDLTPEERDLYLHFLIDGHHSLICNWLSEHPDLPPEQVGALLNRLFYSAIIKSDISQ